MEKLKQLQTEINQLEAKKKELDDYYDGLIKERQDIIDSEVERLKGLCQDGFYENDEIIIYQKVEKKDAINVIKVLSDPEALKLLINAKSDDKSKVNVTVTKTFAKVLDKNGIDSSSFIEAKASEKVDYKIKGVEE